MNRWVFLTISFMFPVLALAQLKSQQELPKMSEALTRPASGVMFGLLDPARLRMNHSFSMSYTTFGGNGVMLNSYTNTINYQISNPLFLRLNLGVMYSPYNTFNNHPAFNKTQFFGGAELFYQPSENMRIQIGVDVAPANYLFYSPYGIIRK